MKSRKIIALFTMLGLFLTLNVLNSKAEESQPQNTPYNPYNVIINNYTLAWNDEFEFFDTSKWQLDNEAKRHDGWNTKKAFEVKDGNLVIKAITENNVHYTAVLTTDNKFEADYGYYEAKIKFNNPSGVWSVFWLYSRDVEKYVGDINKGGIEIDVVEHRNFDNDQKDIWDFAAHTLHWNTYGPEHLCRGAMGRNFNIRDGFHVYGVDRRPDKTLFYVDGELTWEQEFATSKKEFIILSTEIGGMVWAGKLLDEYNHETMTVDYIRYFAPQTKILAEKVEKKGTPAGE